MQGIIHRLVYTYDISSVENEIIKVVKLYKNQH